MTFTLEDIMEAIKKTDTQIDLSKLTPDAVLTEIGADSLDMMNLFVELESALGFSIPDHVFDELKSARQIYEYLATQ